MKTTVKLEQFRSLVIEPVPASRSVRLALVVGSVVVGSMVLGPDQLGALVFGVEQAAEAAGIAADRPVLL